MWLNGMLNPSNLLAENLVDNLADNAEAYGVDPEGPSPFENSDNNLVTPDLNITGDLELIHQTMLDWFDLLKLSTLMGIDIFFDGQRMYIRTDFWGMNKILHNTAKELFFETVT